MRLEATRDYLSPMTDGIRKVDAETEQMIKDYVFARDAETKWKRRKEAMREAILVGLGGEVADGDMISDPRGENLLLTIKTISGYRLNQKKVKAEYPEVYAKCQEESYQVRLETPK